MYLVYLHCKKKSKITLRKLKFLSSEYQMDKLLHCTIPILQLSANSILGDHNVSDKVEPYFYSVLQCILPQHVPILPWRLGWEVLPFLQVVRLLQVKIHPRMPHLCARHQRLLIERHARNFTPVPAPVVHVYESFPLFTIHWRIVTQHNH